MHHSFESWLDRRRRGPPEAEKLVPLVAASGMVGMTRKQLGNAIDLERQVLDELLDGLVRSGLLTVTDENGLKVFRTQQGD